MSTTSTRRSGEEGRLKIVTKRIVITVEIREIITKHLSKLIERIKRIRRGDSSWVGIVIIDCF